MARDMKDSGWAAPERGGMRHCVSFDMTAEVAAAGEFFVSQIRAWNASVEAAIKQINARGRRLLLEPRPEDIVSEAQLSEFKACLTRLLQPEKMGVDFYEFGKWDAPDFYLHNALYGAEINFPVIQRHTEWSLER